MRISPRKIGKSIGWIAPSAVGALLFLLPHLSSAQAAQEANRVTEEIAHFRETHLSEGDIIVGIGNEAALRWYRAGALTPDTPVQIGSVSKGLVGLLFASMIADGTVEEETPVTRLWPDSSLLPVGPPPDSLGRTPLVALATHTSGLPRIPLGPVELLRATLSPADPYRGLNDVDVLRQAGRADLGESGTFEYSNLGYALLGVLLLQSWEDGESVADSLESELTRRVLAPNHLPKLRVNTKDGLPPSFAPNGRRSSPWTFDGYAPAGGVVASSRQMMDIASFIASAREREPVALALRPRAVVDANTTIGLGWFSSRLPDGREMVWHNGTTGTFSAFLAVIPEDGTRIVAASTTGVPLDGLVWQLVTDEPVAPQRGSTPLFVVSVGWGLLVLVLAQTAAAVMGALKPEARLPWLRSKLGGRESVLDLFAHLAGMAFCVAVWARVSPASVYDPALFQVQLFALGVTTMAGIIRIYRISGLLPLVERNASWKVYAGRLASLTLFTALVLLYW